MSAAGSQSNPWALAPADYAKAPHYMLLGFATLLLVFGLTTPLVETSIPDVFGGRAQHVQQRLTAFQFSGLGNVIMAFAAMGVAFQLTKSPRGLIAAGAGIVALVILLPLQVRGPVDVVWAAWFELILAGSFLAAAGVVMARPQKQARSSSYSPGVISLWLGRMTNEAEFQAYMSTDFAADFGFPIRETDSVEIDASAEVKPVAALLNGFTDYASFLEAAEAAARAMGWNEASCALVFYDFRYSTEFMNQRPGQRLTFIGTVPYGK